MKWEQRQQLMSSINMLLKRQKRAGEVVTGQKGESCNPSAIKGAAGQQGKQAPAVSYTVAQGLCSLGPHEVRGGG